jgi:Holliday junction resolvasome RuvABC endonuclease subunit
MKIMAIDASTKSTGIAIFNTNNTKEILYYDCITASSTDLIKRIKKIVEGIRNVLNKYEIDKIILEEVRPEVSNAGSQNLQTHRALMWLQAAIAFMIHDEFSHIKIEYIYPSSWRAACGIKTGRGIKRSELKSADIQFVKNNYNIIVNDDIADAIGIGVGYSKNNNRIDF